jgi:hypothetical protein
LPPFSALGSIGVEKESQSMNINKKVVRRTVIGVGAVLAVFVVLIVWLGWDYDKPTKAEGSLDRVNSATLQDGGSDSEEAKFIESLGNKTFGQSFLKSYRQDRPSHLSKEEWRQVHASLLGHPNWRSERDRVAGFIKFQKSFDALSNAVQNNQSISPEMRKQAQELEASLLEGIKKEQISATEALSLKMLTLRILQPNEQAQEQALKEWANEVKPFLKEPTKDPRDDIYLKRQQEITDKWARNYPPEATDELERMLSQLRKEVYGQ